MIKGTPRLSSTQKSALKWTLFTWLFAPLALFTGFLAMASIKSQQAYDFRDLLVHGELLIVSAVLSIDNIGDVITSPDAEDTPRMFSIVFAIILAIISIAWFAILTAFRIAGSGIEIENNFVAFSSMGIYGASLPLGVFCTFVADASKVKP